MKKHLLLLLLLALCACQSHFTAITPADLDNKNVEPTVGADLLSLKGVSAEAVDQDVVVTAHGYTATPYENKAILDHLTARGLLGSRVMLGAHGTDIEEFEKSTWRDWQKPLESELDLLEALGYQHLNVLTTSTGGPLLLELLSRKSYPHLEKIVMVAPLLEFSNKTFQFVNAVKFLGIRSLPNDLKGHAVGNWYHERPLTTLSQLSSLSALMRQKLDKGLPLPPQVEVLIIQSRNDGTVDPISAALLAQGLKAKLKIRIVDSSLHIPTAPYPDWKPADYLLKDQLFSEITNFLDRP